MIDYLEFYKTYSPPPPISTLEDAYVKHHRKYGDKFNVFYTQMPLWMKELFWYAFWKERNT